MSRIVIICEGQTEVEFVNSLLMDHLYSIGFTSVNAFCIKHSKGGLSNYKHLRNDILKEVRANYTFVTTLIDYYGLPTDFPGYGEGISNIEKAETIQSKIKQDIEDHCKIELPRFLPYIQIHEFEALVFSSKDAILNRFEDGQIKTRLIDRIFIDFSNPEDINDSPNTAPSKRLDRAIAGYDKVVDGVEILKDIGLRTIRLKCPRFNSWLNTLEEIFA